MGLELKNYSERKSFWTLEYEIQSWIADGTAQKQ